MSVLENLFQSTRTELNIGECT